jgi:hypothetical protein
MKPKRNYKPGSMDECQTPPYAFDLLQPFLPFPSDNTIIWEPASGEGHLVRAIESYGYNVLAGDIKTGRDFFEYDKELIKEIAGISFFKNIQLIIVTNPPYSIKKQWQEHCFKLGIPWALLMPAEFLFTSGAIQQYQEHENPSLIIPDRRINFKMPDIGWTGSENKEVCLNNWISVRQHQWDKTPKLQKRYDTPEKKTKWLNSVPSAQFPVAWYTHNLNMTPGKFIFRKLNTRRYTKLRS